FYTSEIPMGILKDFAVLFAGGLSFAFGILLIGNEGFYYWLRNSIGWKGQQPESPTAIWSAQNYPRYAIGIIVIAMGLGLIHLWTTTVGD
ncbi:MAG: hypothetical protein WCC41_04640, partial [Rhodomicrobium sp.]